MAIILKASYSTGLNPAGPSSHQFSLSVRTKVTDLTQVETQCARLYTVLQSSVNNAIRNHGSAPQNPNGNGHWHPRRIPSLQEHPARETWACSRKQSKLIRRFMAKCNLDWSVIERIALERFGKTLRTLNQPQARELIRALHE